MVERERYTELCQSEVSRLEMRQAQLERAWALAALARIAEREEVPQSELEVLFRDYRLSHLDTKRTREELRAAIVGRNPDEFAAADRADREGITERDSGLRRQLREIDDLTKYVGMTHGTVERALRKGRMIAGGLRVLQGGMQVRELRRLKRKRIVDISSDRLLEMDELDDEHLFRVDREELTKYLDSEIGEFYDTWGEEIVERNLNTAKLVLDARSKKDFNEQLLHDARKQLQKFKEPH